MNVEEECDMCYEYQRCSEEKCTEHVLYDGNIVNFARALKSGHMWGDVIYEEDKDKKKNEKPEEKAKNDRKALEELKEIILNKNRVKNCVFKNGKYILKHKFAKACENLKLKEEVLSDGSTYPGGCWAYKEKMCPFMHPDEKDKFDMKGKARIDLLSENSHKTSHHKTPHHKTPYSRNKRYGGSKRRSTCRNRK